MQLLNPILIRTTTDTSLLLPFSDLSILDSSINYYYWNCKKNPNSLKQKKLNKMCNSSNKILKLILNEAR